MLVLDTDHLVEFDEASDAGARLKERLKAADDEVAATIASRASCLLTSPHSDNIVPS